MIDVRLKAVAVVAVAAAIAAVLAGSVSAAGVPKGCVAAPKPTLGTRSAPRPKRLLSSAHKYYVTMKTNCGSFTFRVDRKDSPHVAASFVDLVRRKYFDGTVFHRIVPGFVIQGGDPTGTGTSGPGYSTVDTPPRSTRYVPGIVAMAKTQTEAPGTSGSQFFVVTGPDAASLTPDYAPIGIVVKGLDVVLRIGKLGDANQQPTFLVEIERATVTVT